MGSLKRVQNWRSALNRFILDNKETPREYGIWDCCMAVGKAIESFTGEKIYNVILPYTEDNVEDILKTSGGVEGIADAIAKDYNIDEVKLSYAGAGDVVLFKWKDKTQSLGIIGLNGLDAYVCNDVKGWAILKKRDAVKAWRI